MKYRKFGKRDFEVSALGFGAMRLPQTAENSGVVDEEEAIRMIRHAIDNGVTYLDSAYMYHMGESEKIVGKALQDGYREKITLVTKLPVRMCESPDQFDEILNEQMSRLQADYLDVYLLHGLNTEGWNKATEWNILDWAEKKMAEGKFNNFGFSFHDDFDVFKRIIDDYDNWAMCQIQYNFMDVNYQAGRRGVEYAADKGLAIVVMEPLRGGMLTQKTPDAVQAIWDESEIKRSQADWALSWVLNQPEITLALSGMSAMEQLVENLEIADRSQPGMLTSKELDMIDRVREAYLGLRPVPCTACSYCMPCPNGVDIPQVFRLYNDAVMYNDVRTGNMRYMTDGITPKESRADNCIECGQCEPACPQTIAIIEELKKAHAALTME